MVRRRPTRGGAGTQSSAGGAWGTGSVGSGGRPAASRTGPGSAAGGVRAAAGGDRGLPSDERRFADACAKIRAASQKHLDDYQASGVASDSEEEELEDDVKDKILDRVCGQDDSESLGSTREHLQKALDADANTCLICIGTIRRAHSIWSCTSCRVSFHLNCSQTWARDSLAQKLMRLEDDSSAQSVAVAWNCPNCRCEYKSSEVPSKYTCYCGRLEEPPTDPWLLAHTCGERCNRSLQPACPHSCLLQCHPGPCPPCPVTVTVGCYCAKSKPQPKRCARRSWSCQKACGALLNCRSHSCEQLCHPGECPPCSRTSRQSCNCGSQTQQRPCADPSWQCDKVCGSQLPCGNHRCDVVCHAGACPPCPGSGVRSCPCGSSQQLQLSCTEEVPRCGDTCDKVLDCGVHRCVNRCHYGDCGRCLQLRVKKCRCGRKEKDVVCDKPFLCEVKCKRGKSCGKHTCNKKCCVGDCAPCELVCGRTLACGKHRCPAPCHTGPCYPCVRRVSMSCPCGGTRVEVACGRQRTARPPRCRLPCRVPPQCHHPVQQPHLCHRPPCPPCQLPCDRPLPGCQHSCPLPCHDAVQRRVTSAVPAATPWERPAERVVTVCEPCPPCQTPLSVPCLGEHAEYEMPCSRACPETCGRQCGRSLQCGNHICELPCHVVQGAVDKRSAGEDCEQCELPCQLARPEGCGHACDLSCHPAPCSPCRQHRRVRCHCQISWLHVRCHVLLETSQSPEQREPILSCGNTCPKQLPCGHRCVSVCHSGTCQVPADGCSARQRVRCPCSLRGRTVSCAQLVAGFQLSCDDQCSDKQQQLQLDQERREREEVAEAAARDREEMERLAHQLPGAHRRKERRRRGAEPAAPAPVWYRRAPSVAAAVVLALVSVAAAVYWR